MQILRMRLCKDCKDCKYFKVKQSDSLSNGLCTHPKAITSISYHTGIVYRTYASYMRKDLYGCGKSARYYIDKDDIEPAKITHIVSCTDCKYNMLNTNYSSTDSQIEYALCTHPYTTTVDMVSGEKLYYYTNDMRNYAVPNDIKSCDVGGYLFEPKEMLCDSKDNKYCFTTVLLILLVVFVL